MNEVSTNETVDVVGMAVSTLLAEGFEDGRVISREFLSWALDLPRPQTLEEHERCQWLAFSRIEDFKDRLLREHRIALQPLRGIGYRIVPPADQSAFALKQAASGVVKAVNKAKRIIEFTRMDALSDEERRRHYERVGKLQTFATFTNDEAVKLSDYVRSVPKLK